MKYNVTYTLAPGCFLVLEVNANSLLEAQENAAGLAHQANIDLDSASAVTVEKIQ